MFDYIHKNNRQRRGEWGAHGNARLLMVNIITKNRKTRSKALFVTCGGKGERLLQL